MISNIFLSARGVRYSWILEVDDEFKEMPGKQNNTVKKKNTRAEGKKTWLF